MSSRPSSGNFLSIRGCWPIYSTAELIKLNKTILVGKPVATQKFLISECLNADMIDTGLYTLI